MFTTMKLYRKFAIFTTITVLMVACAPSQPTINPEDVQSQIDTAVAQTMAAQGQIATYVAQTMEAQKPLETPTPTGTSTLIATLTPIGLTVTPLSTSTSSGGGGGGGGGTTTYKYACDPDLHKRPHDNTVYLPGESFDYKFTIKNTGTDTWPAGKDLTFFSGNITTNFTAIELPEMEPGDMFSVGPYEAYVPDKKGRQVMTFKLEGGWCWPYIAINVQDNRK